MEMVAVVLEMPAVLNMMTAMVVKMTMVTATTLTMMLTVAWRTTTMTTKTMMIMMILDFLLLVETIGSLLARETFFVPLPRPSQTAHERSTVRRA